MVCDCVPVLITGRQNMFNTDLTIIGEGFFGTCTALLLSRQGYSVTLVTQGKEILESCTNSLGVLWPSLNDPPTRAYVAHGHEVACYLNDFCQHGIEYFFSEILSNSSENYWIKSPCLRIGLQDFEQEELEKAKNLGFGLTHTQHKEIYQEKYSSYICINLNLFKKQMHQFLKQSSVNIVAEKVVSINEKEGLVTLDNSEIKSEIIILANGVHISEYLPKYKAILVPMSDILVEYVCESSKKIEPVTFRASNGHVGVSFFQTENKTILRMTGPRFLLPQAGVGIVLGKERITQLILTNIDKFHQQIFSTLAMYYAYADLKSFLSDFPFIRTNYDVRVDCHPCDELPLVGEFGKLGKILGCTGFLATGFSSGVWGAKIICDLICEQKSLALHERLQPRRFYKKH